MSFSFSQALISETCPLTQPMGSDGRSQEYERESQLSQEQFSQDLCLNPANQIYSRPASQEFSRPGPTRQCSVPGWTTTEEQQESVSLLDNSQEIGWPGRHVRRTLPRPSDLQQESVSLLANSQELSWQEPPAPRRTLPRPPTWPRIATAGRPSNGGGKENRQDCRSRDDPEGSKGPRVARWRLPSSSNKENIGQSAAKERDLRHHLSEISKQVSKLPTSVSRLLEEAVRFLDSSHASKQGELKQSLETSLKLLKEVAAGKETEANENRTADLSRLLQRVSESIQEEGSRVKGIEERQDMLVKEITGLKGEMTKNFELMERFCQEASESRQKWQEQFELSFQNRKGGVGSVMRRVPRPFLTQAGAEQGVLFGRTGGNFHQMQQQQQGLYTGNRPPPMPAIIAPCNIQPVTPAGERSRKGAPISSRTSASAKVARVLPSRPLRTLRPGLAATATATAANNFHSLSRATHSVKQQPVKREPFGVLSLDSDSQPVKREPFDVFDLDSDSD